MERLKERNNLSEENFRKILEMNPRIESIYVLMTSDHIYFDSVTGICNERVTERYEVVLFLEDGGYTVIDGVKYDIHKGNIRFLRPNQRVYSKKFGKYVSIGFTLANAEEIFEENEFLKELPSFMFAYNIKSYLNLFKELDVARSGNKIEDALLLKYKTNELLLNLYKTSQNYNKSKDVSDKSRSVVEKAIKYMETNLSKNIGLDEISEYVNLHPVYFNRTFSKAIGTPPINYLKKLRLNKAKDLLITTNYKIVNIAKKCGFSSSSYFIVQFRSEFGCTPSEYRTANNDE